MILIIDNYDSFVYNLARYVAELGYDYRVFRHDQITLAEIAKCAPSHIIISPGPCAPDQAGISLALVQAFAPTCPILGVCLGHQVIAQAFGGRVVQAPKPQHGKATAIHHDHHPMFCGLPNPFMAARYHSLIVSAKGLPASLKVTAWTEQGDIMALAHQQWPVFGVQFHPESILTQHGHSLLATFLKTHSLRDYCSREF